jgi:hypothetical protein
MRNLKVQTHAGRVIVVRLQRSKNSHNQGGKRLFHERVGFGHVADAKAHFARLGWKFVGTRQG